MVIICLDIQSPFLPKNSLDFFHEGQNRQVATCRRSLCVEIFRFKALASDKGIDSVENFLEVEVFFEIEKQTIFH